MLKMPKLRRFSLVTIFFGWLFLSLLSASAVFLWHSADVEKLISHYPVFDIENKKYVLKTTKPESWLEIEDISNYSKWALIVSEDWAFYDHKGIDLTQLRVAIGESIKQGRLVRGASTITQQVVKNTLLTSERSLWRKFREMIMSYKLERVVSKKRILEIYLNIVELGKDIYGVKKASFFYFNKAPDSLSAREGAFLAMLLPSPIKYGASFKKKELTPFASEVIDSILVKLRQAKVYDEEQRVLESQKLFYWEAPAKTKAKANEETYMEESDHLDYTIYE